MTNLRLQHRVAVVVGGGQSPGETLGNGRAAALAFAREGARVIVADRDLQSAGVTVAMIRDNGGVAEAVAADVCDADSIRLMTERAVSAFGGIDILHNNVGVGDRDGSVVDLPLESWDRIITTNLTGMFLTCKSVLPIMVAQGGGVIINVSSIASLLSYEGVAYKVSKAGVDALTRQLAYAYAEHGIRVNGILPGHVATPTAIEGTLRARNISREELLKIKDEEVPLRRRQGTALDTAAAAVFLASAEADFVTGALLAVDGGQTLRVG
jgi:NAD(P)-dependent dehydrogenase (short-subunit alcohol dehydrogenase family)